MKLNFKKTFCTLFAATLLLSSPISLIASSTIKHSSTVWYEDQAFDAITLSNVIGEKSFEDSFGYTYPIYQVEQGATLETLAIHIRSIQIHQVEIKDNDLSYEAEAEYFDAIWTTSNLSDVLDTNILFTGWITEAQFDNDVILKADTPNVGTNFTSTDALFTEGGNCPAVTPGSTITFTEPGLYSVGIALSNEYDSILIEVVSSTGSGSTPPVTGSTSNNLAKATTSYISVNNMDVTLEAYNIDNSNYIKLRDFAALLDGWDEHFNVEWDGEKNAINLVSGEAYEFVGSELMPFEPADKTYTSTTSALYKDGQPANLTAYSIDNTTYFKLRDLAELFDIPVDYDAATGRIIISPTFAMGQG